MQVYDQAVITLSFGSGFFCERIKYFIFHFCLFVSNIWKINCKAESK